MVVKILSHIFVNATAFYAAQYFIDGITIEQGTTLQETLLIFGLLGALLWIGNAIIKPILKILTFPAIIITFGLFNVVLNILIIWGVDILVPQLQIAGFWDLLLATVIISLVSSLFFFI